MHGGSFLHEHELASWPCVMGLHGTSLLHEHEGSHCELMSTGSSRCWPVLLLL